MSCTTYVRVLCCLARRLLFTSNVLHPEERDIGPHSEDFMLGAEVLLGLGKTCYLFHSTHLHKSLAEIGGFILDPSRP